jgi:hypothetical protein
MVSIEFNPAVVQGVPKGLKRKCFSAGSVLLIVMNFFPELMA